MSLEVRNEGRNGTYFPTPEWGRCKVPAVRCPEKIITFRFTPVFCQNPHMWFFTKTLSDILFSKQNKIQFKALKMKQLLFLCLELYIFWLTWVHHHSAFPCWALGRQACANTLSKTMQMLLASLEFMPAQDFLENYFITDIVQSNKFGV